MKDEESVQGCRHQEEQKCFPTGDTSRDSRLGLLWRRTTEHETTRGGQNWNPSSSSAVGDEEDVRASPRPCLLRKSDVAGNVKCCGVVPSPAAKAKNKIHGNAGVFHQTWQLSENWVRQLHKALPRSHVAWVSQKLCQETKSAVKQYYLHLGEIRAGFCTTGTATTLVMQVCDHRLLTRSRWTEMHPGNVKSALGPLLPL